jgi:hypothetical protein
VATVRHGRSFSIAITAATRTIQADVHHPEREHRGAFVGWLGFLEALHHAMQEPETSRDYADHDMRARDE